MAATLNNVQISLSGSWNYSDPGPPGKQSLDKLIRAINFAIGTGAGSVNKIESQLYTIAASGTQRVIVNSDSSSKDPLGNNGPAITKLRFIMVVHLSTSAASQVTFGPSATHPCSTPFGGATNVLNLYKDGVAVLLANTAAGFAVVAGASDSFDITNLDGVNTASVQTLFLGE